MVTQTLPRYSSRAEAGAALAAGLEQYAGQNVAVFAVGPGGVRVAEPLAWSLGADLDVVVARRLAFPGEPERVWGAVAVLGDWVRVVADLGGDPGLAVRRDNARHLVGQEEIACMRQMEERLRAVRSSEPVTGRLVIVVADGLASVPVMRAATGVVRAHRPARLVVALPAGTTATCRELRKDADEIVFACSLRPTQAFAPEYRKPIMTDLSPVARALAAWNSP